MEVKVRRAERALERLKQKTGMTETGKKWLTVAVDPFHDTQIDLIGYPDGELGSSVIQCFKGSINLVKPSYIADGTNWDALITIDDLLANVTLQPKEIYGNYVGPSAATTITLQAGGLCVSSGPVGQDLTYRDTGSSTPTVFQNIDVPDNYFADRMRCISAGFEVHNTTSELYKQGSVAAFSQPLASRESAIVLQKVDDASNAAVFSGSFSALLNEVAPQSFANAVLLPGTKIWEAKDGCYVVANQNALENPSGYPVQVQYALVQPDFYSSYPLANTTDDGNSFALTNVSQNDPYANWMSVVTPHDRKGAYFTGLSSQTTLTVNYNCYLERFPGYASELVTLARPTPEGDKAALDAYSECLTYMPLGVPVNENGFGDWFTGAVADIIDGVTGTKFASNIDKFQKEKWSNNPTVTNSNEKQLKQTEKEELEMLRKLRDKYARENNNANGGMQAKMLQKPKPQMQAKGPAKAVPKPAPKVQGNFKASSPPSAKPKK